MDRIDRLLIKAAPRIATYQRLMKDNPYLDKPCEDLLDMMCPETPGGYTAPDMGTAEWGMFICEIMHSASTWGLIE